MRGSGVRKETGGGRQSSGGEVVGEGAVGRSLEARVKLGERLWHKKQ